MKIAMTGGSGFIGTRLIQELEADGHEVVIIDIVHKDPVDILHQDKLNAACAGCDVIYHLAAAHRDDIFPRSEYYEVNGKGTQNVIQAANANGIQKIIFTSSVAVYALNSGTPDETSKTIPFNDYGKSKLEAEGCLRAWADKSSDNSVTIVRPVVVFGENNRGNVYNLINQIAHGRFFMIGAGKNKKSMAYVGNVAAFLKSRLNEKENLEIYNYSDKPDSTMYALTNTIYEALKKPKPKFAIPYVVGIMAGYMLDGVARLTKRTFPISAVRVQKFCADTTVNADKTHSSGFNAEYTLAQGIERMINYDFKEYSQK